MSLSLQGRMSTLKCTRHGYRQLVEACWRQIHVDTETQQGTQKRKGKERESLQAEQKGCRTGKPSHSESQPLNSVNCCICHILITRTDDRESGKPQRQ